MLGLVLVPRRRRQFFSFSLFLSGILMSLDQALVDGVGLLGRIDVALFPSAACTTTTFRSIWHRERLILSDEDRHGVLFRFSRILQRDELFESVVIIFFGLRLGRVVSGLSLFSIR